MIYWVNDIERTVCSAFIRKITYSKYKSALFPTMLFTVLCVLELHPQSPTAPKIGKCLGIADDECSCNGGTSKNGNNDGIK